MFQSDHHVDKKARVAREYAYVFTKRSYIKLKKIIVKIRIYVANKKKLPNIVIVN